MMHSSALPETGCESTRTKLHRADDWALPEVVAGYLQKRAGDTLRPSFWSEGRPKLKLCSPPSHREITPNMLSQRWA